MKQSLRTVRSSREAGERRQKREDPAEIGRVGQSEYTLSVLFIKILVYESVLHN